LCRVIEAAGFRVEDVQYTAGVWLETYRRHWSWRWMPERYRAALIRRAARYIPRLFGAQVIVKASLDRLPRDRT
jgi:hypothetical protein